MDELILAFSKDHGAFIFISKAV